MRELANQRATGILAILVLLTGISFWLTVGHGGASLHQGGSIVWPLVIVLASLKVRWVMLDFMELRRQRGVDNTQVTTRSIPT